jgi:hypothetical protein
VLSIGWVYGEIMNDDIICKPTYMVDVDNQTLIRSSDENGHWTDDGSHEFSGYTLISFASGKVEFRMKPVEIIENDEYKIMWLTRNYDNE